LLDILQERRGGNRFFVKRTHGTVYPCTLPPWLPREVIEKMVSRYRNRLKRELNSLLYRTEDSDNDGSIDIWRILMMSMGQYPVGEHSRRG
jgi:hypothetical protein